MYLLPFLASPLLFIFLFSYPHFLGDRLSNKNQQESRRKVQIFVMSLKNCEKITQFVTKSC